MGRGLRTGKDNVRMGGAWNGGERPMEGDLRGAFAAAPEDLASKGLLASLLMVCWTVLGFVSSLTTEVEGGSSSGLPAAATWSSAPVAEDLPVNEGARAF